MFELTRFCVRTVDGSLVCSLEDMSTILELGHWESWRLLMHRSVLRPLVSTMGWSGPSSQEVTPPSGTGVAVWHRSVVGVVSKSVS